MVAVYKIGSADSARTVIESHTQITDGAESRRGCCMGCWDLDRSLCRWPCDRYSEARQFLVEHGLWEGGG